jgi:predicted GH43/DUF377 family glycosyl hydrolase
MIGRHHPANLSPDPSRTVARLFLPGEGLASGHSRAAEIVARVIGLPESTVTAIAERVVADFASRHVDTRAILVENAAIVSSRAPAAVTLSEPQNIALGAIFSAEFATEGAALCNPSAVIHPDQGGLTAGQLRVAIALRSIGEGHLSSISFAEAVIDEHDTWTFTERAAPPATATVGPGQWSRDHFARALEHEGYLGELSSSILGELSDRFAATEVEAALVSLPERLTAHRDSRSEIEKLRTMVYSAYTATFDESTELSQRVLLPAAVEEDHGMEDARFVHFIDENGDELYRATYTAYDGWGIAPRLITSRDLTTFAIHRLSGSAAHNKGMALFPRPVGGFHLALSRTDGESISLARSKDGVIWDHVGDVHRPTEPWELVQTGNCGSPIETQDGWIALIHGVGPMRTYSLGALLLDLDDPTKVLARTLVPLLQPESDTRNGYVPNVVYSCGGILHHERIWIPIGIGDQRISVYSVGVTELLDAMTRE